MKKLLRRVAPKTHATLGSAGFSGINANNLKPRRQLIMTNSRAIETDRPEDRWRQPQKCRSMKPKNTICLGFDKDALEAARFYAPTLSDSKVTAAHNGFLGTIATLAVIILYAMANMALTSYIRRERPEDFSVWRHAVIPWIGTLALLPVLFVTIYPVPGWPYNITPYLFIVALIVGFVYMYWRESKNPGALLKGATMLVGRRRDDEGEVVWDTLDGPLLGESD